VIQVEGSYAFQALSPSIINTVMPTPPRIHVALSPISQLHVGNFGTCSHSGPKFDKLISLSEEVAVPGFGISSIRDRMKRFVGASAT